MRQVEEETKFLAPEPVQAAAKKRGRPKKGSINSSLNSSSVLEHSISLPAPRISSKDDENLTDFFKHARSFMLEDDSNE